MVTQNKHILIWKQRPKNQNVHKSPFARRDYLEGEVGPQMCERK